MKKFTIFSFIVVFTSLTISWLVLTPPDFKSETSFIGKDFVTRSCTGKPEFVSRYNISGQGGFTTSDRTKTGLVLLDKQGSVEKKYQEDSWRSFGRLGQVIYDAKGNLYTYPIPQVNTTGFSFEKASSVLRLDTKSGTLEKFATLPIDENQFHDAFRQNPYVILGITYDCENQTIYVSSVAGSTPDEEKGVIYAIDTSGKVSVVWRGLDVMGLGVIKSKNITYLLLSPTRSTNIYALDMSVKPDKQVLKTVFDLGNHVRNKNLRVKKIIADKPGILKVSLYPFSYNLFTTARDLTVELVMVQDEKGQWKNFTN